MLDSIKKQVIGYNGCRLGLAAEKHVPQACLPTSAFLGLAALGAVAMAHEEWRDVVGYEGYYQVSNLGNVRSRQKPIKLVEYGNMTPMAVLYKGSARSRRQIYVDELVAKAFLGKHDDEAVLVHINGDIQDCSSANLAWSTNPSSYDLICGDWRAVDGVDGVLVSNCGSVWKCGIVKKRSSGIAFYSSGKNASVKRLGGRNIVSVHGNSHFVDVLVATAFVQNPNKKRFVVHVDGNTLNDSYDNLVWVTADELADLRICSAADSERIEGEEWRDIPRYEGMYQASSFGRVRSIDHIALSNGSQVIRRGRILSQHKHYKGYVRVGLENSGKMKTEFVHRLVASAFIPNPDNLPEVDHINTVRDDNRAENLRWVDHVSNCRHSIEVGNFVDSFSGHAPTDEQRRMWYAGRPIVRNDGKRYPSISEACRDIGCKDRSSIKRNLKGKTKTCMGYSFSYASD